MARQGRGKLKSTRSLFFFFQKTQDKDAFKIKSNTQSFTVNSMPQNNTTTKNFYMNKRGLRDVSALVHTPQHWLSHRAGKNTPPTVPAKSLQSGRLVRSIWSCSGHRHKLPGVGCCLSSGRREDVASSEHLQHYRSSS